MVYPYVWIAVFVILVLIEVFTAELTTIWFAGGALIAFVLSLFSGISIWIQLTVFIVVSVVLLLCTRPALIRLMEKRKLKTNVEPIPGKTAIVEEKIDNLNSTGSVEINGLSWTARSENNDEIISVGSTVEVLRVEGVKVIVKLKEDK